MAWTSFGRGRRGDQSSEFERKFAMYFPRAFAYAYSNLGDETASREVVGEAFGSIFVERPGLADVEFRVELFTYLSALCREHKRAVPLDIGIAPIERDVVTLAFDAGLTSGEVNLVLGGDTAAVRLTRALKKMRATSAPSVVPSFFRLS